MPPAIPNRPEINEVEMMVQAMRTKSKGVMRGRTCGTSWPGLSPPSTDLVLCAKDVDARHKTGHDESGGARQRAINHVDGVLHAIDRDERPEARAFLLAEQHLVEHVEPVERHARPAVFRGLLAIEERLAAADLVDD